MNNSTIFKSSYKELYRKLVPAGLTEAEADFIEEAANLTRGDAVLDIMCGYGRHSLELGKRGYRVTAVDNLPDYIREINETAVTNNLAVEGVLTDVASAAFSETYDAVICMGNSFASFEETEAVKILHSLSACLKQGGIFIINSWMIGEIVIKNFQEKEWLYVDGYKYLLDNKYCFNPTRIETDHIVIDDEGRTDVLKGIDYIFSFAELEALLKKAGFVITEIYATPRKRKYRFGDNKAYIVATKK